MADVETEPTRAEADPPYAGSLLAFLALTFLVTWTFFIAAVAWSRDLEPGAPLGPGILALVFVGTIAPSFVAIGLTARAQGTEHVRALLGRILQGGVSARWYAFAIGYMAAIKLTAALIHRVATGAWPPFGREAWYVMLGAMLISTWTQAGEEVGWRGFALPRLAARIGLGSGSVVLGVIWAVWHLPLFYLRGADSYGQSFIVYLLYVIAISIAIAWLYWRTHGSLLLVMLMHAAINNTKDIVPSIARPPENPFVPGASPIAWIALGIMWVGAGVFLVQMRRAKLTGANGESLVGGGPGASGAEGRV